VFVVDAKQLSWWRRAIDAENFGSPAGTPLFEYAVNTVEFRIQGHHKPEWNVRSYEEDTLLMIRGRDEPSTHIDRNTLTRHRGRPRRIRWHGVVIDPAATIAGSKDHFRAAKR